MMRKTDSKRVTRSAAKIATVYAVSALATLLLNPAYADTLTVDTTNVDIAATSDVSNPFLKLQPWRTQINLPYTLPSAAATYPTGKGVLVGIADTGVQTNHPYLNGKITQSYNVFDGSSNVTDSQGHGTHVAGIIAGSTVSSSMSMQGIAPDASIAFAKVFSSSGSTTNTYVDAGINWLVSKAKAPIVTLSLGSSSATGNAALLAGVKAGTLFTIAAGNDGKATVSWPARYAKETWANSQIIVVGSVNSENVMSSFSNRAGDVASWYVVAPGEKIASSYTGSQYAYMSGTSMATPIVAGQAALIKGSWQFLTAQQIASIIFKTATRLGKGTDTTPDSTYGWGLINIDKSLSPVGTLSSKTSIASTSFGANGALILGSGTSGTKITTKSLSFAGTDDFGRAFTIDMAPSTPSASARSLDMNSMFSSIDFHDRMIEKTINGHKLAYSYGYDGSRVTATSASYSGTLGGTQLGFGSGNMTSRFFGLSANDNASFAARAPLSLVGGDRFNAPYFGLVKDASHLGFAKEIAGTTIRAGVVRESSFTSSQGSAFPVSYASPSVTAAGRTMAVSEFEKSFNGGRTVMVASVGVLREDGSMLGSYSSGSMALNGTTKTTFASLAGAYAITPKVSISGMASIGVTSAMDNAGSFITDVSRSKSAAWSLGLAAKDALRDGDKIGLVISMPNKILSGSVGVAGATSQNADGSMNYQASRVDLRSSGTEIDTELSYSMPIGKSTKITGAAMHRLNPGHDASAKSDVGVGVRITTSF